MPSHSKVLTGAAVTSTARASTGTIAIPSGKGGTLVAVEVQVFPTLETVVNGGGLVELENDALDWKPFEFYTQKQTCVTSGAVPLKPLRIKCKKKLPANSTVTVYYTPQDNQSQILTVTLHWIEGDFSGKQTYMKAGIGSAITQVTIAADHVSIAIPAEKGGTLLAVMAQVWGTLETVVNAGGLVALKNESAKVGWEPSQFYTIGETCVTCGGVETEPQLIPKDLDLPGNSTVKADYTPQDNQSQKLSLTLIWE